MADTTTTNLLLTKPEVGASTDTWGTKINTDLDTIDALFNAGPVLKVAKGGTGAASLTANNVILGNDTSAVQLVAPSTTGNLLTSNGTTWQSTAPAVSATSTTTFTNKTISGADNTLTVDGTTAVGFRSIPQNSQSAAYTLVLTDSGKHIFHPSADTTARTFTIPANSSVAYPIGTAITFINQNGAGVVTIAITTDTMRLSPAGTTGSRTLAANGSATCVKVTSTEWLISGSGLT